MSTLLIRGLFNEEFQDIVAVISDVRHAHKIFGCKPEWET